MLRPLPFPAFHCVSQMIWSSFGASRRQRRFCGSGGGPIRRRLMLRHDENMALTQVGAGTPMGRFMRRYWIPAAKLEQIAEPGGAPVRVRLMGESLVAFRD